MKSVNDVLKAAAGRAHHSRAKKMTDAVLAKVVRIAQQNITVDQFLERVRAREPHLYERTAISFNTWRARYEPLRAALNPEELAPDGLPYSLGPKVRAPRAPKLTLNDIITQYEQDLKASDA